MGEEKPDEDLMGKRKSSPRLSTTFINVDILYNYLIAGKYTSSFTIFKIKGNRL